MKKILLWAVIAIIALSFDTFSVSAKDIPSGIRMEIAEDEEDDNVFSIFTYKDEDGTMGYYLGLGNEFNISEAFDIEILGGSLSHIDEVCLKLGETADEALVALDGLLALLDKDVNTFVDLPARLTTGAESLSGPTTITCTVRKKLIGGKYLQFCFLGEQLSEVNLSKSSIKFLKKALQIDMKRSKK